MFATSTAGRRIGPLRRELVDGEDRAVASGAPRLATVTAPSCRPSRPKPEAGSLVSSTRSPRRAGAAEVEVRTGATSRGRR